MTIHGDLEIGSQLAGYRILRLLGQGGTGLVYEAEHVVLGRKAALKTLLPYLVDDAEFRERLIRESRMVAALDHPTVIPIYDAGDVDGVIYVAMRLVRGSDLSEQLARVGRLGLDETITILDQVAGALDAAHDGGLVHRDVKPANVLLEEHTARAYLTDFGIAKHSQAPGLTKTGYFLGTIDCASPEQIQGKPVGPPADVYAFGCMLFECLSGHPPFSGATTMEVARAHVFESPPALRAELGLPPALDEIVARTLAKAEDDRPPSCGSIVDDVRAAIVRAGTSVVHAVPDRAPQPSFRARLPVETRPLFGREAEVKQAAELLRRRDVRLLTLTGLGGAGKTRLALAVAEAVAPDFDDVLFVDLSPVRDPALVASAIAEALELQEVGAEPVAEMLAWRLAGRSTLLVLDNFEHVLPAGTLVADLLAAADVSVLVTSQSPLRTRQEHQFPVLPLAMPDPGATPGGADEAAASPAVALFVEQARAVKPDFALTSETAPAVGAICARLDGLPLAIELAASRVNLLSPQAILARLTERFEFLAGGSQELPERQQTLRNALDWTCALLSEKERVLLARLSVFAGGWSLEAAEAVCGEAGGVGEMLNGFASLVDKSLVRQRDGIDGEPRFEMLETVRAYALERLEERGEAEAIRRRHAARYLALAEAAEPELVGPGQNAWLDRLDEEEANIWAALEWTLDREVELGLRLAGALARFWSMRGAAEDGRRWLAAALAKSDGVPGAILAKARFAAGYAAIGVGDFLEARGHIEESLELARAVGDERAEAAALAQLGWLLLAAGEHERAREAGARALARSDAAGDKVTASGALNTLAELAAERGDHDEAERFFDRSLRLRREVGDRRLMANSLVSLARRELGGAASMRTDALLQESLALARSVGDSWNVSVALSTSGALAVLERAFTEAEPFFVEALEVARRRGDKRAVAECLVGLAAVAAAGSDARRGARLLGAAGALRETAGADRSPVERLLEDTAAVPLLRRALRDAFEVEVATGSRLDADETVRLATGGGEPDAR